MRKMPIRARRVELSTDATPCLRQMGLPAHEIAHAIGMVHEHLRHDRDNQVTVFDDNIYTWYWNNFEKLDSDALVTGGLPYDKGSLMHYGPKVRGCQTLESVKRFERSNGLDTALYKNYLFMNYGPNIRGSHSDSYELWTHGTSLSDSY